MATTNGHMANLINLSNGDVLDALTATPMSAVLALRDGGGSWREWVSVGRKLWAVGKLEEAKEVCKAGLEEFTVEPEGQQALSTLLGNVHLSLSRAAPKFILSTATADVHPPGTFTRRQHYEAATASFNTAQRARADAGSDAGQSANSALFLGQAILQLAQGNFDMAMQSFEAVLAEKTNNIVALMGKARILHAKRKYREALRAYQDVLRRSPTAQPDPRIGIGLCFYALRMRDEALKAWTRAAKVNPKSYGPRLLLGLVALNHAKDSTLSVEDRAKEYASGISHLQVAFKLNNKNASAASALGYFFLGKGNREMATKLGERAVQFADVLPSLIEGHLSLARVAHHAGDWARAAREYKAALEKAPDNVIAQLGRGQLMLNDESSLSQAVHHFDSLVQAHPRLPEATLILASLRSRPLPGVSSSELQKNRTSARELFDRALRLISLPSSSETLRDLGDDPSAHIEVARLWERESLPKTAAAYSLAAQMREKRGEPVGPELRNNLAAVAALEGRTEEALEGLQGALKEGGEAPEGGRKEKEVRTTLAWNLGRVYEMLGRDGEARDAYGVVLGEHPEYIDCKIRLAALHMSIKSIDAAHELLKQALTTDINYPELRAFYTYFLSKLDLTTARRFAEATLKQTPHDVYALCALGWATYAPARDLRVKNEQVKKERARKYREAVNVWEKALRHDPRCAYAAMGVAITLAEDAIPAPAGAGKKDGEGVREALGVFGKIKETWDGAGVWVNMGHCFWMRDDFDRAIENYEHASRHYHKDRDVSTLLHLCRSWYSKAIGEQSFAGLATSLRYAQQARDILPQDKSIWYNIAMIEQKMLQMVLELPNEKRSAADVRTALDQAPESQQLFNQLAAEEAGKVPFNIELAEQRASFGENLIRKGPAELKKQEEHEEQMREKLEAARRAREEAARAAEAAETARLEEIKRRDAEIRAQRLKMKEEMEELRGTLKAEEDAEEYAREQKALERAEKKRKKEEGILSEGEEEYVNEDGERVVKKKKKSGKKKLRKRVKEESADEEGEALFSADEGEAEAMSSGAEGAGENGESKSAKPKRVKKRIASDDEDESKSSKTPAKKTKVFALSKETISDSDDE